MNIQKSKYTITAEKMDKALFALIEQKDIEFITVKDICQKAGVNRSTFYLHYNTIGDLLDECSEFLMHKFSEYFRETNSIKSEDINLLPLEKLNFVTPQYILPYLKFIKDNASFFQVAVKHKSLFSTMKQADRFFSDFFVPVLRRYKFPDVIHNYVLLYYLNGMMAIVDEWIRTDYKESPEKIAQIIVKCVLPYENEKL